MGGSRIGSQRFFAEAGLTMSIVCAGLSVFPLLAALVMVGSAATGPAPGRAFLLALSLVGLAVLGFAVSAVFHARIGEPMFQRRTAVRQLVYAVAFAVVRGLLYAVGIAVVTTLIGILWWILTITR